MTPLPPMSDQPALLRDLEATRAVLDTRMDGADAAARSVASEISEFRALAMELFAKHSEVNAKIDALDRVVETTFDLRMSLLDERKDSTDKALVAALTTASLAVDKAQASAKEAVDKAEASTIKQIDGIKAMIESSIAGLNDKIEDLKARTDSTMGVAQGQDLSKASLYRIIGAIAAGCGIIAAIIGFTR